MPPNHFPDRLPSLALVVAATEALHQQEEFAHLMALFDRRGLPMLLPNDEIKYAKTISESVLALGYFSDEFSAEPLNDEMLPSGELKNGKIKRGYLGLSTLSLKGLRFLSGEQMKELTSHQFLSDEILSDQTLSRQQFHPALVDFFDATLLWRTQRAAHEKLIQAVRHKEKKELRILDATAGLGQDAFLLASQGHRVTLVERHPIVAALLRDGLRRLYDQSSCEEKSSDQNMSDQKMPEQRENSRFLSDGFLSDARLVSAINGFELYSDSLVLIEQDSLDFLAEQKPGAFDVVYIDPMFAIPSQRSALPGKAMQYLSSLFRAFPCDESSFDEVGERLWLEYARKCSEKVVVKRHQKAPCFGTVKPHHTLSAGQSCRFDVYQ